MNQVKDALKEDSKPCQPQKADSRKKAGEVREEIIPVLTENSLTVLKKRYLRKNEAGGPEETPAEMFRRVAKNISEAEYFYNPKADVSEIEDRFYRIMATLDFIPNSPTLMNAGRDLQQLSACFVMPIDDSIDSIFEVVKNTALIHKSGGGTGFSFSRIRPVNDIVSTSHGRASGPISFMKVFNEATEAINQGGFRRGANMAILRVDHPDIMAFISAKEDPKQLNNFNLSVGLTDAFMDALDKDAEFSLLNPRTKQEVQKLSSTAVFREIVKKAWQNGEPGIVFLDRINRDNPTPAAGVIESTNPCGEQPLLPYESCNLGSINLSNMVEAGKINYTRFRDVIHTSVRFLDNVIDMNRFPLPKIGQMTKANRKIGLGIMGFADMLIKLEIPYASEKALGMALEIMQFMESESRKASADLAAERGPFPDFDRSVYARDGLKPMRNATTTTIAPTGTISIIAGCSSGIEPLFAISFVRNVLDGAELVEIHPLFEKKAKEAGFCTKDLMKRIAEKGSVQEIDEVPTDVKKIYLTAHDISPEWHIRMQAAFQTHTDNAVSKTVNFRRDASAEDVEKVYRMAHALGCKGVTVYRDGSRENQVLSTKSEKGKAEAAEAPDQGDFKRMPKPRPEVTRGSTRKMRTGCGNLYVTINEDAENRPFEIFSVMGKAGGCAASQTEAICRLISFALRSGADVYPIVEQLKGISCHSTAWGQGGKILSCADAIAKAVELYMGTRDGKHSTAEIFKNMVTPVMRKGACPECGGIVEHEGGCVVCRVCGFSECA